MGGKWKKIKLFLSKRICMISPFDADPDNSRGSASTVCASHIHSRPFLKSTTHMLRQAVSSSSYHTGPLIIIDTSDANLSRSAPSYTPPSSFSGPIPSRPGRSSGFRIRLNSCAICLESMKPGQGQALFTAECLHTFHFPCIASNIRHGNQVCPVCRATWNDLPWQAGTQMPRSQNRRSGSHRRATSAILHSGNVARLHTSSDLREHRSHNLSFQYLEESAANGMLYPGEADRYDDDEPLNLNQSALVNISEGWMSGGSSQDQKVSVKALPEVSAVPACESREDFTVLINLKSPVVRRGSATDSSHSGSRAPLDLVAVLDISGSMIGRKLMLLKQAMSFVVHNLSSSDRLSVVAFSSSAKRIFPLQKMGREGQCQALQAIDALVATGGTNIAEGLRKGVKVLEDSTEKNPVSSIMLLSDGQDTYNANPQRQLRLFPSRGISDMRRSMRRSTNVERTLIPVHTFGFGSDHDATALHSISEISGGTFSYIQAEEVVQDAFAQCIGGLLSVVSQAVQLTISCVAPGVLISSIHTGRYDSSIIDSGRQGIVKLGDLYAEEERDILVGLKFPALSEFKGEMSTALVQAACMYRDPVTQQVISNMAEELSIWRPLIIEEGQQVISLEVDRQRNRLQVAEAIADARSLADKGKIEAAQCGLENARARLEGSVSAHVGDRLCRVLQLELDKIRERMANRQMYERSGRAYALSAERSHMTQRASTRGDSADDQMHDYQTHSMVDMITQSHTQMLSEAAFQRRHLS